MVAVPKKVRNVELMPKDAVLVASRRWDSNGARLCAAREGQTLEDMVRHALQLAFPGREERFYALGMTWCRARVDGVEFQPFNWHEVRPLAGSRVEVLFAPGKGGGKNPLAVILSVAVAAVAMWAGPAAAGALGLTKAGAVAGTTVLTTAGKVVAGVTSAAIMTIGGLAVNALFPPSMPTIPDSSTESSQTYSLNGGQNSANPGGYVPLVLGRYRMTPPLAAKSWTSYEGEDQFFHMLVLWGHEDMKVTDFRIGDTSLSEFDDVTHVFHGSSTGNDLRIFGKSYNEQSVGAALNASEGWVTRSIGEADEISFDIAFSALGKANKNSGQIDEYEVLFEAQCALEGTENWQSVGSGSCVVRGASQTFSIRQKYVDLRVWTDMAGNVSITDEGKRPANALEIYPNKDARVNGCAVSVTEKRYTEEYGDGYSRTVYRTEVTVASGSVDAGVFAIKASQTKPLTKSYRSAVPHGEWKVRVRRTSEDTDDTYIYDKATWSTVRAVVNKPPFSTPVPVCVSELRIRASEQLSGYVSDFNGLASSVVPDWNGTEWEERETSNPASLLRYVLTSKHGSYNPVSTAKLDEESFREFHEFCAAEGFTFNFVCDTEALAWKRMVQIAAAGRGAVTYDNDGKISVIIDRAGKVPVQMFTPRNSWGLRWERDFQKYPHALRAKFRNEASDYEEANAYVYADGYSQQNATNIVEWECEGKTNWNEVWRFGRYYLASMRLRPERLTLSTDWEWRMCRRGDLVIVAHDVLTNTFGTARIAALVYRVNGQELTVSREEDKPEGLVPVGVVLDDTVIFSEPSPARYGIAVRTATGRVLTYEVTPQYGQESAALYFRYSIAAAQVPALWALASVALFGSSSEMELGEYLVAGITPGDDMSADLTLIPYAPEIMDADTGSIPAWSPPVRLPTIPKRDSLPVPVIRELRSDESVLVRSGDSLLSCIAAWYSVPSSPDASLGEIQVQMRAKDGFGNEFTASAPLSAPYIAVQGVEDGRQYSVALRLVSSRGVTSMWSTERIVTVVGKTSAPPAVEGLTARIADPQGVALAWEDSTVADFDHYEVTGAASTKTVDNAAVMQVFKRTGALTFAVQAVDTLGLASEKVQASVTVLPPAAPAPSYAVSAQTGATVSWPDCKTTWSIDHYDVEDAWLGETQSYADPRFSISPRPLGVAYRFFLRAVDVFGNVGPATEYGVTIGTMDAPEPSARVDGTQVVVSWAAVASPFAVEWYEVQDANGALVGKAKSTELRFEAPKAGVHGWRVRGVDISGNLGPWGECSLTLGAPKAPALAVRLSDDSTMLELAWTAPASQLPLQGYDVVRQWTVTRPDGLIETLEEDYGRHDALALTVLPVSTGTHSFLARAVDSAGNTGPWGSADFVVQAPGRVTFFDCSAVDNNVMIYYTDPHSIFFKVREYLVEEMQDGFGAEIGRTDTHFFSEIKNKGGVYGYGVTPLDVAGNLGTRSTINVTVSDPPDFIIFTEEESLFNGERVNMVLDGMGSMIGPVPEGETWQANAERVAGFIGGTAEELTWQAKAAGGYPHWLSPPVASGRYVEVIDAGTLVPSTKITVDVTQTVLEGEPVMTCRIEVSADGESWREATDNGTTVFATSFQFVRFSFEWTGGLVAVSRIFYSLNVKRKTDFGQAVCYAEDEGGTEIFYNVTFTEVQSLPRPNVVNDTSDGGLTAYTDFDGGLNPVSFRCFVKDKEGNRVTATVDWLAGGV